MQECVNAFGVVGRKARLALCFALEIELCVEIIAPGFVEETFDQGKGNRRGGGEPGA